MRHRVTIHILLLVGVVFIDGGHGPFVSAGCKIVSVWVVFVDFFQVALLCATVYVAAL